MHNTQNDHSDHAKPPNDFDESHMSVTYVRRNFGDIVNRVRYQQEVVILEKGGKQVAALIPLELLRQCAPERQVLKPDLSADEPLTLEQAFGSVQPIATPAHQLSVRRVAREASVAGVSRELEEARGTTNT